MGKRQTAGMAHCFVNALLSTQRWVGWVGVSGELKGRCSMGMLFLVVSDVLN